MGVVNGEVSTAGCNTWICGGICMTLCGAVCGGTLGIGSVVAYWANVAFGAGTAMTFGG